MLQTVEVYDPVADQWERKADMPTARDYPSTSVVNGKIYAIGGWTHGSDAPRRNANFNGLRRLNLMPMGQIKLPP